MAGPESPEGLGAAAGMQRHQQVSWLIKVILRHRHLVSLAAQDIGPAHRGDPVAVVAVRWGGSDQADPHQRGAAVRNPASTSRRSEVK